MIERYLVRGVRLANATEDTADAVWSWYRAVLEQRTKAAQGALRQLITRLPAAQAAEQAKAGFVDVTTPAGRAARARFFHDAARVYGGWRARMLSELGQSPWPRGALAWEISLGLKRHRPGEFLQRLRQDVGQLAGAMANMFTLLQLHEELDEARRGWRYHPVSARITGRGLPRGHRAHSRTTSIILRGLKGVMADQEKALLENLLRGLDALPRGHANALFDATKGVTLRDALNKVADDFSTNRMSTRQLKLSMQTHLRAMVRRLAETYGASQGARHYVLIPPVRPADVKQATPSTRARAFLVEDIRKALKRSKGSATSLGVYPGDKVLPLPIPVARLGEARQAAAVMRQEYLDAVAAKKVPTRLSSFARARGVGTGL